MPEGDRSSADSTSYHTLRPHGGYRRLRSFQVTQIIYDTTVAFCDRFIDRRSRTRDQMVQAARSGRQNIAEGSRASSTSGRTELRLVSVARASLDELLLDYEDFLRQRRLRQWAKDDRPALEIRALARGESPRAEHYGPWLSHTDPAVVANAMICLIHQANYLLDHQIRSLERQFVEGGGYSEQLYRARLEARAEQAPTDRTDQSDRSNPPCPQCGKTMVLRIARKGPHTGSRFWGCAGYPDCKGTRPVEDPARA
jgi:restriction system protein